MDYGKSRGYDGPAWYFTKEGPNGTTGHLASRDLPRQSGWKEYYFDRRSRKHRVSHPDSWTQGALSAECRDLDPNSAECKNESIGGKPVYTSPIIESCQTNHVVLLSDGEPTGNAATTRIQNLIGESCDDVGDFDRQCGSDLARWMKNTDFNSRADGIQGITTYTIGFDLENNVQASSYLRGISDQSAGGGGHYSAKDTEGLVRTFEDIISSVTDVDTAFVSPGATVNQFNRLTHRNDIYFSLFKPTDRVRWPGNLKRYRITDDSGAVVIQDVNGDPAIDEAAGFFATDSHSFWSDAADGIDVSRGGFAGELALVNGATPRQVYTYTGPLPAPRNVDLTDPVHKLHEDNPAVEAAMLAIPEEVRISRVSARLPPISWPAHWPANRCARAWCMCRRRWSRRRTPQTSPAGSPRSSRRGAPRMTRVRRLAVPLVALALFGGAATLLPDTFLTAGNLLNVSRQVSMLAVVAMTMTLVMAMGDFDLSVGSMASLAGVTAAVLFTQGHGVPIAVGGALLVGFLGGLVNGMLVSYFRILPFVATLGTLTVFSGVAFLVSGGKTIFGRANGV